MEAVLSAMVASVVMVLTTVLVHYEALALLSRGLARWPRASHLQVALVILGIFSAHTVEIWLYAVAYAVLEHAGVGLTIAGVFDHSWLDYLYFSTVSYTSLGLGDVYPMGALRLLTGVEALNGLLLIGWSASFTYLVMERRWRL